MIQTNNLTKHYGSRPAVQNLSLTIGRGELYGFLGPNGAGKTTTIRMMIGLLRPTEGSVQINGLDVAQAPLQVKKSIGYLAQTPLLYNRLTGREFLRFLGGIYNLQEEQIEARSESLFNLLELTDKADDLIEGYSGGMRQKIGLCGALLHDPPVLILDEPLVGLDPQAARKVKILIREHCEQGNTVLFSTHILEIAERVCDRVGILDNGRLIFTGTQDALRSKVRASVETSLEELFLKLTGGDEFAEVAEILA